MCSLERRFKSLHRHLDEEGWHVHANTAGLAIDHIRKSERIRKSALILLQQVEFELDQHDGPRPGWLVDCRKDITE